MHACVCGNLLCDLESKERARERIKRESKQVMDGQKSLGKKGGDRQGGWVEKCCNQWTSAVVVVAGAHTLACRSPNNAIRTLPSSQPGSETLFLVD